MSNQPSLESPFLDDKKNCPVTEMFLYKLRPPPPPSEKCSLTFSSKTCTYIMYSVYCLYNIVYICIYNDPFKT